MSAQPDIKDSPQAHKSCLWTGIFIALVIVSFCCSLVSQGLNAGTSIFLTGIGYSSTTSGMLAMVFSLSAGAARLAVGPIIDRGKCTLVTLAGILVLLIGTLMSSFVDGVVLFAVGRFLQGAGFAAATTAAATAAADVVPQERLGEGIGYYGLGQALALSVGPAIALWLVGMNPSTNLFMGMALVCVVGFAACCGARYEHHPKRLPKTCAYCERLAEGKAQDRTQEPHSRKVLDIFESRALPGAVPMAILCPMFGFGVFFAGLYGTSLGYTDAGLFYTVSAVAMIAVRLLSGRFMDTVAPIKTYLVAVACGVIAFVMLYFASCSEVVFLLAGLPYGICLGVSLPLNQSVSVKNTPSERWGAANALFLLFNDLGIGLSSAIWGAVSDMAGFQTCILAVIVCQILSYLVARITYRSQPKREQ